MDCRSRCPGADNESAVLGVAWGLVLTSIYTVVIRSASTDKTAVAVAVNVLMRNTALAVGVQVAFAVITGAGLTDGFPAESGFTRVFLMGFVGACVTLLASATLMPGRTAMPPIAVVAAAPSRSVRFRP